MIDPSALPYRPCVGIMLLNADGHIWLGQRRNLVLTSGKWQMPQGGIDPDESPATAALRELAEETGATEVEILREASKWLHYDLPPELVGRALGGRYRGQRQKWFAMRFLGKDSDFNIHHPPGGLEAEFDAWRWAAPAELPELIVPFKRAVYEAVLDEFSQCL
jgi:putative (di)nucleoside polyphosphate hydrolase